MGQEILEGLKGVELVNKEFQNFDETNIVWDDPDLVNIAAMEKALKDAGTYLQTAK